MVGELLGAEVDLSQTQPGQDNVEGNDDQEPKGGLADQDFTHGLMGLSGHGMGKEEDFSPEESNSGPSSEAVRVLEGIV